VTWPAPGTAAVSVPWAPVKESNTPIG